MVNLYMEFVNGNDLDANLLEKSFTVFDDWHIKWELAFQTARAIQVLHSYNVKHRDLSCQNFVMEKFDNDINCFVVKVIDFGMSKSKLDINSLKSSCDIGTVLYKAPETYSLEADKHEKESDIYSLGMVFYEIATRKRPFFNLSTVEDVKKQLALKKRPDDTCITDEKFKNLVNMCWAEKPNNRPDCTSILKYISKNRAVSTSQPQLNCSRLRI